MDLQHSSLSPEQTKVVTARAPMLAVMAGPGSGKTTVLVHRYASLLNAHHPAGIVLITFTRNAAKHLRDKIIAADLPMPTYCGTLHGYARRVVKSVMLDEEDADATLKSTALRLKCRDSAQVLRRVLTGMEKGSDLQKIVCRRYHQWMRQEGLCDNDTMLIDLKFHLECSSDAPRLAVLMVDEAQDSGTLDWMIYDAFNAASKTFVGDVDQSMYGFRGGRPDLLEDYADRPGVARVEMNDNYRSLPAVVTAANALTGRNLQAIRQGDGMVTATIFKTEREEEDFVLKIVANHCKSGNASNIAILCRYNADVQRYEHMMRLLGVMPEREESRTPRDWKKAMATIRHLSEPANAILYGLWVEATGGVELPPHPTLAAALLKSKVSLATTRTIEALNRNCANYADLLDEMRGCVEEVEPVRGQVSVMTYHAAKGLEFDNVLLPLMDTPPGQAMGEEEKRCFFVALTRARNSAHCFAAKKRVSRYNGQIEDRAVSPFVALVAQRIAEKD